MSSEDIKKLSANLKRNLQEHKPMLSDGVRNQLIFQALKESITEKTKFLDIGSGTGVWAILAAKLGAKHVVAVELEECLIPIIYQHAKENNVENKIEIIHANADELTLNEKFDVIISELFGFDAYGKKTIDTFIKLRESFLAKNGVLIPQKMVKYAAPVHIENSFSKLGKNLPFKSSFFKAIDLNFVQNYPLSRRNELKILAEPKKLQKVDFRTIIKPPNLKQLSQLWEFDDISKVNAFAVFNHSYFTDKIILDSFKSSSWTCGIYEFEPIIEKTKDIKFEITFKNEQFHWKISSPSNASIPTQIYSPGFAVARIKMAQSNVQHQ